MNLASLFKVPDYKTEDITLSPNFEDQPRASTSNAVIPELEELKDPAEQLAGDDLDEELELEEVEATLGDNKGSKASQHSDDSESDSSDSSDDDRPLDAVHVDDGDDDSDHEGAKKQDPTTQIATKNEILNPEVKLPPISEVDPAEILELAGEISSVIDSVVIVRGIERQEKQPESTDTVLDTDSLLVFEDRKVLGLVFETFGPTTNPMYSVRFPSAEAVDLEKVSISRRVYHVPQRSFFVFPRTLALLKGSDASNKNDEEPAPEEMEYSDDEQEREAKRRRRGNYDDESGSQKRMRVEIHDSNDNEATQSLSYEDADPYAPVSVSASPIDQVVPTEDPYRVEGISDTRQADQQSSNMIRTSPSSTWRPARGRPHMHQNGPRGRGRGRGRGSAFRNQPNVHPNHNNYNSQSRPVQEANSTYNTHNPYALQAHQPAYSSQWQNPTPYAPPNNGYYDPAHYNPALMSPTGYNDMTQGYVAPHINPRFANNFATNMNFAGIQGFLGNNAAYGYDPATQPYVPQSGEGHAPPYPPNNQPQ
ncbi:NAF1-domain-containing protein [Sistotremastrum niveocremeum HHB9708]|uniref:H/ACA ribonucleoprotein complex non-core subunit NAF1 n=2 Tax=Sistotremastraceae TaxID=3402574 RepID=A0A164URK1_9AGAM|nr:NAF1-domain-containing protein [Sistotremastrum niveocremeum HHB9708]KZT43719.1 NAF1-domain-containing protein [Sistotremastrum suecicum HHB10207 ss-3]